MASDNIEQLIAGAVRSGPELAVATIVRTRGSTPRGAGTKMAIAADGTNVGTVGGGCAEGEIRREALNVLDQGSTKLITVDLIEADAEGGMLCGGKMDVYIEVAGPQTPPATAEVYDLVAQCLESGRAVATATVIDTSPGLTRAQGSKIAVAEDGSFAGTSSVHELDERIKDHATRALADGKAVLQRVPMPVMHMQPFADVFFEVTVATPSLIILGGGHIALPLARMASMLGFDITVVDDRLSFANQARFPEAKTVICDDFATALQNLEVNPATYAVIVTRGHQYDELCLRTLVASDLAYLGMIGSKRKVRETFQRLRDDGVADALLDKVYSPIGLDIGAETPEEIALCIMAEITMIRRRGQAPSRKVSQQA